MHIVPSNSGILAANYSDTDWMRKDAAAYVPQIYMALETEFAMIKNTYGSKESVYLRFIPQHYRFEG